jgi:tRNA threonylcarbamoyladenosine biosynthesis protein TsaB
MIETPLILSIETTGQTCGVALSKGEILLSEYTIFVNNLHDKLLAELTFRIINDLQYSFDNLDAIAVSAGPGSFTGLRIGVAFAKGLCFNDNIKLIEVPTLEAFAFASIEFAKSCNALQIVSLIKSHQDLFYIQKFNSFAEKISEIEMIQFEELNQLDFTNSVVSGTNIQKGFNLSGLQRLTPRFISKLAYMKFVKNEFKNAENFIPLYSQEFIPKTKG